MKVLKLTKNLFAVDSKLTNGLICGLKKLQDYGFVITAEKEFRNIYWKILEKEKIQFEYVDFTKDDFVFEVLDKKLVRTKSQQDLLLFTPETEFTNIVDKVLKEVRTAEIKRETKETKIIVRAALDGEGNADISTGIGFFDHMLEQIARHANIDLYIMVEGDLQVDEHHTVEDTGIALGETILKALGEKVGIQRYGFVVPMDDSYAECAIDLGGRSRVIFNVEFKREKVGAFPTELTEEFFQGLSSGMKANIYLKSEGKNEHHKIESLFKSFAKALNEACRLDERNKGKIPSTKGLI